MTTNYIEGKNEAQKYDVERKKKNRNHWIKNEKRSFGRLTLFKNGTWKIEEIKDKKDTDKTVRRRATRKNYGNSIIFL